MPEFGIKKMRTPFGETRGITPTVTYAIYVDGLAACFVNGGDEAYFAVDVHNNWLSTWYDNMVEAASAGLNKIEERKLRDS
jgi:hypothetical protein